MKRFGIIAVIASLAFCGISAAQEKGDLYAGGTLGISGGSSKTSISYGSETHNGDRTPATAEFRIGGEFGWFFADRWKLGASLGYQLVSEPYDIDDNDDWLKQKTGLFSIGPEISYYLRLFKNFHYTPSFGIYGEFGSIKTEEDDNLSEDYGLTGAAFQLNFAACEFRPAEHFGIAISLLSLGYCTLKSTWDDYYGDYTIKLKSVAVDFCIKPTVSFRYYF